MSEHDGRKWISITNAAGVRITEDGDVQVCVPNGEICRIVYTPRDTEDTKKSVVEDACPVCSAAKKLAALENKRKELERRIYEWRTRSWEAKETSCTATVWETYTLLRELIDFALAG